MNEEIFKNLPYLINRDSIIDNKDYDVESFIKDKYNEMFLEWNKQFPMFNIPSGMISISIDGNTKYINVGNNSYDENTIFDIASMSKLYTEFILFSVLKDYNLSLDMKIKDLVPFYESISDLTLMDLISFNNKYLTTIDMRECKNITEGKKALRTAYIVPENKGKYLYTDVPIMILTDILEEYTKMDYKSLFKKYILDKYDLHDTYLELSDEELKRYVSINGRYVNDPKANIFGGYYGHAGVKATSKDFIKFLNNVFTSEFDKSLFIEESETVNEDNKKSINKARVGNFNLVVPTYPVDGYQYSSLASDNLPKTGFAVQGSVRCQGETCVFNIDGENHIASVSVFLDLFTQLDNVHKYEETSGKKITNVKDTDVGRIQMVDVRNILPYKGIYKQLLNAVGEARIIELNNVLTKEKMI